MAFQGNYAFVGGWNGFQIFDISNPSAPVLRTAVVCPGGQGDVSVYGDLLFVSVEETRAKKNCADPGNPVNTTAANRFRGIRIFNISNINSPTIVKEVQTCRGSHTHTLVEGKDDPSSIYIYVSGTSGTVGQTDDITTCDAGPATNPNPSQWRIEVIKVPLASPAQAAVVNEPRLFKNEQTGAVNGLQNAPSTPQHPCASVTPPACDATTNPATNGAVWQPVPDTNSCHDITVFESQNIAAGACEGNGLLLDISDPANPRRIDAVADPLFAYWHGATFSNDGRYVIFTDEWGGGTNPRCRATDQLSWGGNAIYEIVNRKMVFRSYYKVPMAQTVTENCVSHIPSIVPVDGKHVFIQAWYQGGRVDGGLHERGAAEGDRLLRPRADRREHARVRRLVGDVLVQRHGLRLGALARLRLAQADADERSDRGRSGLDGERRPVAAVQPADPAAVPAHGDEHSGHRGRHRPGDTVARARGAGELRRVHAGRGQALRGRDRGHRDLDRG